MYSGEKDQSGHDIGMTDDHITEPFLKKLKATIDADPALTAAGLAKKAGLADSAIRLMFKRGTQSPSISTAEKICAALGTTLPVFMSEAATKEERQIVDLVSQLPYDLRLQLLGYGQALLENSGRDLPQDASD